MDSQRTSIHKANHRIATLFPDWPSEKIVYDDVAALPLGKIDDDSRALEQPVLLSRKKAPTWQDIDLKGQM